MSALASGGFVAAAGAWYHPPAQGRPAFWEQAVTHAPERDCPLEGRHPRSECALVSVGTSLRFK